MIDLALFGADGVPPSTLATLGVALGRYLRCGCRMERQLIGEVAAETLRHFPDRVGRLHEIPHADLLEVMLFELAAEIAETYGP
ncbi:MAG TPA: hypothetical protein VKR79_07480 [Gaiellaceae bacterium]|nr:hypothetical protein [Gaiellaceae bacterium]